VSDYVVTCCSTADMPDEYFKKRNIPYVCFHFNMDGKEYPDDLGQTMPFEEFYARIAAGAMPTTSQVNVGSLSIFGNRI
jgi:fatty acid-binding protein DegV